MLCNLETVLKEGQTNKKAVGSFNVYSYETIAGVVEAAKKSEKNVIVSFGASYLKNMSLEEVGALVRTMAENVSEKIVLHLDHCGDVDTIKQAINAGFTSVMYDGSALSFEENIKNTKQVCLMAHEKNVSVEAELGSLALGAFSNETEIDHGEEYTNPEHAKQFVLETGVDALAVSIGTVHGMYKGTPNIRVDILKEISKAVDIPLVLHGGSGTPEEKLLECIKNGIVKINVNTEISQYTTNKIKDVFEEEPNVHLSKIGVLTKEAVTEIVCNYIKIFEK